MSVLEYAYEQRSIEWHAIRNGKVTGSQFKDIMKKPNANLEWTQAQAGFLLGKAAERITGEHDIDTYTSKDMQWGIDHEDEAMAVLNDLLGLNFRSCGYFENTKYPGAGSSPDGIEDEVKRSLEIKCPSSKTHLRYFRDSSELWKDYSWQTLGETLIPDMKSPVICSYDPRFPEGMQLVIFEPSDFLADLEILGKRLIEADSMIKGLMS